MSKQQREHQVPKLGRNNPMHLYMVVTHQLEKSFARKNSKVAISQQRVRVTRKLRSLGCVRSVDSRSMEVILNLYSALIKNHSVCPLLGIPIQRRYRLTEVSLAQGHRED